SDGGSAGVVERQRAVRRDGDALKARRGVAVRGRGAYAESGRQLGRAAEVEAHGLPSRNREREGRPRGQCSVRRIESERARRQRPGGIGEAAARRRFGRVERVELAELADGRLAAATGVAVEGRLAAIDALVVGEAISPEDATLTFCRLLSAFAGGAEPL